MARASNSLTTRLGHLCRSVAVMLISGVLRRRSPKEINHFVKSRPFVQQVWITLGTLLILLGLSFFAASFGWIGLLVFWLLVIVLVK